ncbi:hypothetical protein [Kineococcus aurantiacus]|uniref:Uncharacterized protein n=1 Tax=Kineococcus aurantiacus TaxID=37633 RepID=A0A7Y9DKZ4_9ACTN|nr:hypothetical protein [Kineococcus aurantiacus]NYD22540.1 hypothetical protein [Kineococcus aurantiacus]
MTPGTPAAAGGDDERFARLRKEAARKGWTLQAPTNRHPGYLLTSGRPGEKDARIAFGAAGPVLTLAEVEQWLEDLPRSR